MHRVRITLPPEGGGGFLTLNLSETVTVGEVMTDIRAQLQKKRDPESKSVLSLDNYCLSPTEAVCWWDDDTKIFDEIEMRDSSILPLYFVDKKFMQEAVRQSTVSRVADLRQNGTLPRRKTNFDPSTTSSSSPSVAHSTLNSISPVNNNTNNNGSSSFASSSSSSSSASSPPPALVAQSSSANVHGKNSDGVNVAKSWKARTDCGVCHDAFTFTNRKHHCRKCGDEVCNKCSSNLCKLSKLSGVAVRVCDTCFVSLQSSQTNENRVLPPSQVEKVTPPFFVDPQTAKKCKICQRAPDFKRYQFHHCHICGFMFCPPCTAQIFVPPAFQKKDKVSKSGLSRACVHCVARLEEGQILLTDGSGIKQADTGPMSEEEKELQARRQAQIQADIQREVEKQRVIMERERKLQGMTLEEQFEEQKNKLLAAQERQMKAMAAWKEKELKEARSGASADSQKVIQAQLEEQRKAFEAAQEQQFQAMMAAREKEVREARQQAEGSIIKTKLEEQNKALVAKQERQMQAFMQYRNKELGDAHVMAAERKDEELKLRALMAEKGKEVQEMRNEQAGLSGDEQSARMAALQKLLDEKETELRKMDQLLNTNIPEPPAAPEAPDAPPDAPPGPPGPPDEMTSTIGHTPTHKFTTTAKPATFAPMSAGGLLDGLQSAKLKKAEVQVKPQAAQGNGFMTPEVLARMKAIEEATKSDDNAEDDDVWSDDD